MGIEEKQNEGFALGVKRSKWRTSPGMESGDREFVIVRPKVLSRDKNACQKCGVEMEGLHVHHRNDNHSDNRPGNLETQCELDHAPHHIGMLGKKGKVVYIPGVSQVDISHLYRLISIAIMEGGELASDARAVHEFLLGFSIPVEEVFGTSNPGDFGNALLALSDTDYHGRHVSMEGLRVIFNPDSLSGFATKAFKAGGFDKNNSPQLWDKIHSNYVG